MELPSNVRNVKDKMGLCSHLVRQKTTDDKVLQCFKRGRRISAERHMILFLKTA